MDWRTRLHVRRLLHRILRAELTEDEALDELEALLGKGVTPQPPTTGDQLARPASPGRGVG